MKKSHSNIQIDDMILELRQMINQSSHRKTLSNHNHHPPTQSTIKPKLASNIQSLIQQTTKLINHKKHLSNQNSQVRGKILAASELLKDQNPLIINYVRHKIQSEIFTSQTLPQLKKPQLFRLQQQKQALAYQKKIQLQKQQQRRQQLVTSIKQFDSNSRVRVDVHEIDNLIFQEEPQSSYLINLNKSQAKKVSSKSNEVKNSNLYISQVYNIQEEEKTLSQSKNQMQDLTRLRQEGDIEFTQVVQEIQSHVMVETQKIDPKTDGLKKVLIKYPHLSKIFYQFLKNQFHIMHTKNALSIVADIFVGQVDPIEVNTKLNIPVEVPQGHVWKNQKKKAQKSYKRFGERINDITQKFKFKAFAIVEENKVAFERKKVSERRINKMIGESKNFHPKKCVLTKNQLIYFEEKQSSDAGKYIQLAIPQNTKSLQIQLQRVQSDKFFKQQGSFFSKKQINTQLITVKGKNKTFKFENNFLQGTQLATDLKKLMASKVYTICSTLNGLNNLSIFQFINNIKSPEFLLSSELLPSQQSFIKKDQKDLFIKIICDLLAHHQELTHFSLSKSKLLSSQISDFVKEFRKMDKLKVINLSHLRLTKQNFQEICQCVNDIQTSKSQIEVNLSDCRLDDDCFVSNVGIFTSFCSKVKHLNLSDNFITAKTVQIIKVCLQNINTQIRYLEISNCPIRELSKLNGLIKESRKLQILEAENISLGFEEKTVQQVTRFFDFIKKCNPNLKRINLGNNGCLNPQKYSYLENNWNVSTIEELIVDLMVKEKSDKDKKELKRTDNMGSQKTVLLMRPILS